MVSPLRALECKYWATIIKRAEREIKKDANIAEHATPRTEWWSSVYVELVLVLGQVRGLCEGGQFHHPVLVGADEQFLAV